MIYVFENLDNNASVVYAGETLTEQQKEKAVAVASLPVKEVLAGKTAVLKCKKATNEVWYEYIDTPKDEVAELRANQDLMQKAIDDLIMGGAI
jgi:oxalate decarboxylase/phosphoglucose isomerase-like protein (cupin superfamily)